MNFASQAALRFSFQAEPQSLDMVVLGSWTSLWAALIGVPAAILAILVVRGVDIRQEERYLALQRAGTPIAS